MKSFINILFIILLTGYAGNAQQTVDSIQIKAQTLASQLTGDQRVAIDTINAVFMRQVLAIGPTLSPGNRKTQIDSLVIQQNNQLQQVMTGDQYTLYLQLKEAGENRAKERAISHGLPSPMQGRLVNSQDSSGRNP